MTLDDTLLRLRGALGNALVWGATWFAAAFAIVAVVVLLGLVPEASWLDAFGLAARFGIVGGVAGGAFAGVLTLAFRGRDLSELSWARVGAAGAVVSAVFVPLFLQAMNLLSGDGLVDWSLVLDDAIWTSVFGGSAAGGSVWIAQRSARLLEDGGGDEVGPLEGADPGWAEDPRVGTSEVRRAKSLPAADQRALDRVAGDTPASS